MSTRRVGRVAVLAVLVCLPSLASASSSFQPRTTARDLDLEPGWPVKTVHTAGTFSGGQAVHTLVGNIDADPELEILATGLARGPLYAWNADGTPVSGWPVGKPSYAGYPALAQLSQTFPGAEVVSGYGGTAGWGEPGMLVAYTGAGTQLAGWPATTANYVSSPPAVADIDGDGLDEIFVGEEDWKLHAYTANGALLPGWPAHGPESDQERHTPAIGDIDGDGDMEIVTASGYTSQGMDVYAYHHDGTLVAGFPVQFSGSGVSTYPVIGDIDNDGAAGIIVMGMHEDDALVILSGQGTIERSIPLPAPPYGGTAPALADLDRDGTPEIVIQTDYALHALRGDGSAFPGWPIALDPDKHRMDNSSPVVGDVDGDHHPDIVIVRHNFYDDYGAISEVLVYDRYGNLHPRFPKQLPLGDGAVPAIADIDLDGRNEIIITGADWYGHEGYFDKVWVYDLGGPRHGKIEWGQFGGGPQHQGRYPVPTLRLAYPLFLPVTEQ